MVQTASSSVRPVAGIVPLAATARFLSFTSKTLECMVDRIATAIARRIVVSPHARAATFCEVRTPEMWRDVLSARRRVCTKRLPYLLPDLRDDGGDAYDPHSFLFTLHWNGQIVGSLRATPYPFETQRYLPELRLTAWLGPDYATRYIEWGRLVVDGALPFRQVARALVTYAGLRLLFLTRYRRFFAYMHPRVEPVTRGFLKKTNTLSFRIPHRGSHDYIAFKGNFADELAHGWPRWLGSLLPPLGQRLRTLEHAFAALKPRRQATDPHGGHCPRVDRGGHRSRMSEKAEARKPLINSACVQSAQHRKATNMQDHNALLKDLDAAVTKGWERIHRGRYFRHVKEHGFSKALMQATLVELYHYTRHNSLNQAVAALRADPNHTSLLKFVYEHAREELGHEKMLVHDLKALQLFDPSLLGRSPLPATQALIGYLYHVALQQGPLARLGYSYWAENSYDHIGEMLNAARAQMGVKDAQLSFFVAHSNIDAKHSQEVREAIREHVREEGDQTAVVEAARTSLYLTGQILEDVVDQAVGDGRQA